MPLSLSKMATNTASVTFCFGSDPVTVTYYPGKVTEKALADLQAMSHLADDTIVDGFGAFNAMLAGLIKSWDVFEDDEQTQMFPVDATRFSELPFAFRMQVLQAIMQDIRPETMALQTRN